MYLHIFRQSYYLRVSWEAMCLWLVMCVTLQCAWCVTVCDFVNVPQVNPEHNSCVDNYKLFGILSFFMIIESRCNSRVGGNGYYFYYIHTEKYSPQSYVVKFRTQISSNQSEERTMVFTSEKNDTSNQNRERCFFHV